MRLFITIFGCMFMMNAMAQSVNRQQYIKLTYKPNQTYSEQASETIVAVNTILARTKVEYSAGRAVELRPGFLASQGAVFTARIQGATDTKLHLATFPNPFDKSTTIQFDLPEDGVVSLYLVNEKGQIIEQLLENSQHMAGRHEIQWQADAHQSGVYIPVLRTAHRQVSTRVIKK